MADAVIDKDLVEQARELSKKVLDPHAEEADRTRRFPEKSFQALKNSRLLEMFVPPRLGGSGSNYSTFVRVMELLGAGCASSAMCLLMHSCGTAIIAAAVHPEQEARFLKPITMGKALVALAQSEEGPGSHFHSPRLQTVFDQGDILLDGVKTFVTSGGHADLYVTLARASGKAKGLNMLVVERDTPGLTFEGEWDGMGLAASSSITMRLSGVRLPRSHLLGEEGSGSELLFGINARVFVLGVAALNVGIAQAALDIAVAHAQSRSHPDSGGVLGSHQAIRFLLAEMHTLVEGARQQLYRAAWDQDEQRGDALLSMCTSKVLATEASVRTTNLGLQVCGGQGYRRRMPIERLYRDARAGAVMNPTSELLKEWIGKTLLGMPL